MVKDLPHQSVESSRQTTKVNGHLFSEKFSLLPSSSCQTKSYSNIRCKPFSSLNNSAGSITSQQSTLLPVKLSKFSKKENAIKSPDFSLNRSCFSSSNINMVQNNLSFHKSPKKTDNNSNCNGNAIQNPIKDNGTKVALLEISKHKAQPALCRKMLGVFKENQDVLARWSDGLYYLGTISQVFL